MSDVLAIYDHCDRFYMNICSPLAMGSRRNNKNKSNNNDLQKCQGIAVLHACLDENLYI